MAMNAPGAPILELGRQTPEVTSMKPIEIVLYVEGSTPPMRRARSTLQGIVGSTLKGRCDLEVIDVRERPDAAGGELLLALPMVVLRRPGAVRRVIGDLGSRDHVLRGLGLETVAGVTAEPEP